MNVFIIKSIILLLCFLLINGFFVMIENALTSSRRSRLEHLSKEGKKTAKKSLTLIDNEEENLRTLKMIRIAIATIFLGLFIYIIISDIAKIEKIIAMGIEKVGADITIPTIVLIALIITPIIIVLGFILPKKIAHSKPEKILTRNSSVIKLLISIFYIPYKITMGMANILLAILRVKESDAKATEEDVKAVIQEGFEGGEIEKTEQDLVERVFSLDDRKISSVLTHKNDIVWVDISSAPEEVREKISENPFSVYPVADERLDNIKGVVTLKDLIDNIGKDVALKTYVKPANFLPENLNILETLQNFKATRFEYALVTDEFGGIQGIVTLSDLLNAIVGDNSITPNEVGYELVKQEENSWLVDGQYPFYDLLRQLGIEQYYNDHPYNTLSGLILDKLDTMPASGDKFKWNGLEIEVIEMDKARIDKVMIKKIEEKSDENEKKEET